MDPRLGSSLDVVTATCLLDKAVVPPTAANPGLDLLTAKETAAFMKLGLRTFWRLVKKGILPPAHVNLGSRTLRWNRSEVVQHLMDYSQGRRRPPPEAA